MTEQRIDITSGVSYQTGDGKMEMKLSFKNEKEEYHVQN